MACGLTPSHADNAKQHSEYEIPEPLRDKIKQHPEYTANVE
jgi:hypothetical protein